MPRKLTLEIFILNANSIHDSKYNYNKVTYINNSSKVIIICPKHGEFLMRPNNHLNGQGCPNCGHEKRAETHKYDKFIYIEKAKLIHENKYDYSNVKYIDSKSKIIIICPIHGEFEQVPASHLQGIGCIKCAGKNKNTTKEFIERAKNKHGCRYNYTIVEYINNKSKIKIICTIHGIFEQIPNSHLSGQGCPKCANKNLRIDEYLEKARLKHNDKYDYSLVDYINNKSKIKIICPKHGFFEQKLKNHLNGSGCFKCAVENISLTQLEFIERANKKHNYKYDYVNTVYVNAHTKIKIICSKHGEFSQLPFDHLNGSGCSKCKESKGEKVIRAFLETNNINYIHEKKFNNCRNILPLPFDFYLPEKNVLIEYDGIQHFKPLKFFGGEKGLLSAQKRDYVKTNYAKTNNIELIRIAYNENIEEKLSEIM